MASWRGEYLDALKERDDQQQHDSDLIDACAYFSLLYKGVLLLTFSDTELADRTAAIEAEKLATFSVSRPANTDSDPPHHLAAGDGSAQLRSDLAEALRSKAQLQSRLKKADEELEKLKHKTRSDGRILKDISSERLVLITKVKDRGEELKGKAKLLEVRYTSRSILHILGADRITGCSE
jgi:hypothetical protein